MAKGTFARQDEVSKVISCDALAVIEEVKKIKFGRSFFYNEDDWKQAADNTKDVATKIIALGQKIKKDAKKLVPE